MASTYKPIKKNREIYPIDMALIKQKVPVSAELGEILSHFHDYSMQQFHITPSPDGVHFKGKIFLLIN